MAWLETHTVLRRHRKNVSLARELHLSPEWTMGNLIALWHTVLEQQEDGDLKNWPDEMIAASGGFKGKPALIVELLYKHGFLDRGTRLVHDWLDYAGRYLKTKYGGGKSKAENRPKLEAIWSKHGRFLDAKHETECATPSIPKVPPGGSEGVPKVPPTNRTDITETNKTNHSAEKETFNAGIHTEAAAFGKRIVAIYMDRVRTSHRNMKHPAERLLAQQFLDEPKLNEAEILRGIECYAKDCDAANAPADKRTGPKSFFENRSWASYDGTEKPVTTTKSREELLAERMKAPERSDDE